MENATASASVMRRMLMRQRKPETPAESADTPPQRPTELRVQRRERRWLDR